jgi:hypothetical protein
MGQIMQQAIGLLIGGAEGAGGAEDPSRTFVWQRRVEPCNRGCGHGPRF